MKYTFCPSDAYAMPGMATKLNPTFEEIVNAVVDYLKIDDVPYIFSITRSRPYIYARQIIQYLALDLTNLTQAEIGRLSGGRDHATVINSRKVLNRLMDVDIKVKRDIGAIRQRI